MVILPFYLECNVLWQLIHSVQLTHLVEPKKISTRKTQKFQLFRPIGTQCVMGVQSVRAKARRKLMHLSLRLVFTWNRIYNGNISFVKGLKQLNNS